MLLAVDAGNSRLKLALFCGDRILARCAAPSADLTSVAEVQALVRDVADKLPPASEWRGDEAFPQPTVTRMAIASVAPRLTPLLVHAAAGVTRDPPLVVAHDLNLGLTIGVREPARLGADRIANAVAAETICGSPVIVADFGTALTLTVVGEDRRILGGAISPGLRTASRALAMFTGQLPDIGLPTGDNPPAIGADTEAAIRSGTLYGVAGAATALIHRVRQELGRDAPVVATGGAAGLLAPLCGVEEVEPDLTFLGLRLIAERNPASRG